MKKIKQYLFSLTKFELILWLTSIVTIIIVFTCFKEKDYISLTTSLIGATALIFLAKGNVVGAFLSVIFGLLYVIISYSYKYYGEMITYGLMTVPISIATIVSWIKNPSQENVTEVKVNNLKFKEYIFVIGLSLIVTVIFYFILKFFNTTNLIISTISIFTSFSACYLSVKRSEYYAIFYALNDIVLIILWILATIDNSKYISMVICFIVFLINDIYGYINWRYLKNKQAKYMKKSQDQLS